MSSTVCISVLPGLHEGLGSRPSAKVELPRFSLRGRALARILAHNELMFQAFFLTASD